MPTIFITNPLQALQAENLRLRRENERLRQQLAGGGERRGLDASSAATPVTQAAPAQLPAVRPAPPAGPGARTSVPRPMIHLIATDGPLPRAPRPSLAPNDPRPSRAEAPTSSEARNSVAELRSTRAEPEALDDAAARFRLLELD